ncbi:MAG: pentapeptide repeat-containing protein [Candidatus Lernaella stagnicola]|nr:pentapeptide repeat-containing protein [Candidatus Lernaella stagnicola]
MTKDKVLAELQNTKNLAGWTIAGVNLRGVDFSGADLERAELTDCRLEGASFARANLHEARFVRCRVGRVDWSHADLRRTHFVSCGGIAPSDIATVEREGAIVEQPTSRLSALLGVGAVIVVAAALFLISGGYELFSPTGSSEPETTPVVTPKPLPSAELLTAADTAFAAADFPRAKDLYGKAFAQGAGSEDSKLNYADACRRSAPFEEAITTAKGIVAETKADDARLRAQTIIASAMVRKGANEEGLALYDKLLAQHTDRPNDQRALLMQKGTDLWKTENPTEALATFQKLLSISESNQKAGVWMNIALVHRDAGKTASETAAYRKAAADRNAPSAVRMNARVALAMLEIRQGRLEQGRRKLLEAAGPDSDAGQVLTAARRAAAEWRKQKKFEPIESLYRQLLEVFGSRPGPLNDARIDLANLLADLGRSSEALALYKKVAAESTNPTQKAWAADTVEEMESSAAAPPAAGDQ